MRLVCLALAGVLYVGYPVAGAEIPVQVDFDVHIRPILSDRCFKCHGPDGENREADLRLDRRGDVFRESNSGNGSHVVKPGDPNHSELYVRIASSDDDMRMPPPGSNLSLTSDEIELIRRWIEQGAPWQEHWSFLRLRQVPVPRIQNEAWPINDVDRFVLARLEEEGLAPSPRASRERLIRRLSFDLTGLPPTLHEIDSFLADKSDDAFAAVVDRLLESLRFGERMAANWLDVARYSDTYGYQVDRDRFVWPWRDWVIKAFNDNMPYDQFIAWQLAGDLLPDATDQQTLATTFNRLHPQKVEGGSIPEEFRVEYVVDRSQTFATAFLGLTLECARCHDHKFDPISQKEYYQLFAFFNNIDEAGLYSYFTESVPTPTLLLEDDKTKAKIAALRQRVREAERQLESIAESRRDAFQQWMRNARRVGRVPGEAVTVNPGAAPNPGRHREGDRETSRAEADCLIPDRIAYLDFDDPREDANKTVPGRVGNAVQLTGDDGIGLKVGNFRRFEPFSVSLWMNTPDEKERAVVFHRSRAWTDAGSRGYQLLIEDGRLSASLIHFWPGNAIRVRTLDKIPTNTWLHVAITYDGSSRAEGLRIFINGGQAECHVVRDNLFKNITGGGGDHITIGERFRDRGFTKGLVDEFQVFARQLTSIEVEQLYDDRRLVDALRTPLEDLTGDQRDALFDYYLATADPQYRSRRDALRESRKEYCETSDGVQEIMVMRELPRPRPAYLLKRGAYDARGERVGPGTPAVFPPFPPNEPTNRLGLARWLTGPNHALTARVAVNRMWQLCFGQGLVRTPEDFGRQGEMPTHPELLEWLARDFVDSGWDVKRLMKLIVTSATYRQSAVASPELLARDPDNRFLGRAPSYRLPAEMLRDNALAVSGLLVETIGGPPTRPYELEEAFSPVKRDQGSGLYRRSLYTYWKRTGPAPAMMTLDASKRDVCHVRREQTSSPLQALVLMNGPQFVEAARMLGQRLLLQHDENIAAVLDEMFRTLTSRKPTHEERKIIEDLYGQQLTYFEQNPARADEFLRIGESPRDPRLDAPRLAAVSAVANTLMSFEECTMKQ